MVEHIDRRLPHVAGALGSREEIRGRGIDRPVAVPEPQWVQDVARTDVILDGELRHLVGGIVPPGRQQPVAVLVDDEGGEVVVLAAVFQAVLSVREDVDEIVTAVIAPGCRPLACAAGVVVGVLATATIAAFEIACRVDDETGVAKAVTDGLLTASQKGLLKESGTGISFGIVSLRAPSNPLAVDGVLAADELDIGRATRRVDLT